MIKPTVGRVVWYVPAPGDTIPCGDQVLAAHIAYVHSDDCVNLMVIDMHGDTHTRSSVTLVQDGAREGSYCTWMPYQKGQAAKTDSVEAKLQAQERLVPGTLNHPAEQSKPVQDLPAAETPPLAPIPPQAQQAPQSHHADHPHHVEHPHHVDGVQQSPNSCG